jgi:hypothetical protein
MLVIPWKRLDHELDRGTLAISLPNYIWHLVLQIWRNMVFLLKYQSPRTVYVILAHVFTNFWMYAYKCVRYRFSCTSAHCHTVELRYVSHLSVLFMYAYNPVDTKSSRYSIHTSSLPYSIRRAEIQNRLALRAFRQFSFFMIPHSTLPHSACMFLLEAVRPRTTDLASKKN